MKSQQWHRRHDRTAPDGFVRRRFEGVSMPLMRAAMVTAALCLAMPAMGAEDSAAPRMFDIAAGSLEDALASLGAESGVMIAFTSQTVSGKQSAGVHGRHSLPDALSLLLQGTGLKATAQPNGGYILERAARPPSAAPSPAAAPAPTTLSPIDVSAEAGAGTVGYVAKRSAIGTKTDTPLNETPQSISVVTRAQIDRQNPQTMDQALRYTAGIEPESRGAFTGFDFVYGRGFVLDRYLDGLKLQGAAGNIPPAVDIYNLDRIEVLRGPASVLYGQASPGGLVNMVSKMPTADPTHEILLQGGNRNDFEGAFDLGGPVDQDKHLLYRVTGLAHTADNQVDFAKNQRISIAPSVTWTPDTDTSVTLYANYQRDPRVGLYNFVPATGTLLANPNGKLPTSFYAGDPGFNTIDRTQYSVGYKLKHRFDSTWTVRQNFRYMHVDGNMNQVLPLDMSTDGRTLDRYVLVDHERLNAATLDNQIQANFATGAMRHTLLGGVDFQHTTFDQSMGQGLGAPSLDIWSPVYNQPIDVPVADMLTHQTQRQLGVYAQDQMRLGKWAFLLGGREDWTRSGTDDLGSNTSSAQSDRKFTWRAGAVYLFDNGVSPYVSYSTSFTPQIGTRSDGSSFVPTTGQQYEAGVKYQPRGSESFVTASAYRLTQQNVATTDPLDPAFRIQTGEIRSQGVELEGHLNLAKGLNLIASYGYNDPTVTRSNDGDVGKMPLNVPRNTASLWMDYAQLTGPLAGLDVGGGVRYIGATFGDTANTLKVPGFTLVDAAVAFDLGRLSPAYRGWRAGVNVSNLFDKTYVSECSNTAYCLYGVGRTVLATLRISW
jgi:iron complex outermembrane receptor protein